MDLWEMMRIAAVTSHEDHEGMRGQVMSSHVKSPSQVALLGLLSLQSWQTASVAWPNLAKLSGFPLSSYGETLEGQLNGTRKLHGKRCPQRFNSLWYLMAGSLFGIKNINGNWVIKLIVCFWCQWARLLDLILPTFGCCTPRSKANADILSHRSSLVVLCFGYSTIASYVPHPGIGQVWRFTQSTYFLVGSSQIATRVWHAAKFCWRQVHL